MDRAEAAGLGVAVAGHAVLLGILSLGLATATKKPLLTEPMEVSFVEEVALRSSAPTPSTEAPPPSASEPDAPAPAEAPPLPAPEPVTLPEPPAPTPPPPQPRVQQPRPQPQPVATKPQPAPKPVAAKPQPAPKPAPPQKSAPPQAKPAPAAKAQPRPAQPATAKAAPRRPGLKLDLSSLSDGPETSRSTSPPAAVAGPAVQASLASEVRRQLKPHWKAPTGADVELLRTEVTVALDRGGGIERIGEIRTSGQTDSNRLQVKLHQEQAVRAIRLAAPFKLPAQFYDAWKVITPTFDRRLSQ
jgi:outer membrane biosynthesis protein TonB